MMRSKLWKEKMPNGKIVTAKQVRDYAFFTFILPARRRDEKTVSFSANFIHNGMALVDKYSLVCRSIDDDKFPQDANVILIRRDGPKESSIVSWTFKII